MIIFCLFSVFLSITSSVKLPFTPNLSEIWGAGSLPQQHLGGREAGIHPWMGYRHTCGLTILRLWAYAQRPSAHLTLYNLMHSSCFCTLFTTIYQSDFKSCSFEKVKDSVCFFFFFLEKKQIITNYMSAHIWAFQCWYPSYFSVIGFPGWAALFPWMSH